MKQVVVIIGAGGIGVAIARRQGFGKTLLLADFNEAVLSAAADELRTASYAVETQIVDVSSRDSVVALVDRATSLGSVMQVVNTAGLSPNMAPPERVLAVDLYGTALVFEAFGEIIAPGGAGLIISSMAGHMLPPLTPEENKALAFTPADELLDLPVVKAVPNSMVGYMVAKRANHLRVQAEAIRWGERGARVNSISPGIIATPLAQYELNSPIGDGYRAMIAASPTKRMAPPEEIAVAASYLLGPDAGFVTGSDPFMQRLRNAADLFGNRYHGRPSGRIIPLVIENDPHRSLADLGRKLIRRLTRHGSTFSGVGASDKPGAVHFDSNS